MQTATPPRKRGQRGPTIEHNRETPSWRIIYGVFGSQSNFCEKTGTPLGTAALWLKTGLIPAHRQSAVRAGAARHGIELDPALFVPTA